MFELAAAAPSEGCPNEMQKCSLDCFTCSLQCFTLRPWWILKTRMPLLQIALGTNDQILLEFPLILDYTLPTKHVYPTITARAVFSELMLRGTTINSKATSTRGKRCHDVMVVQKQKFELTFKCTGAKKQEKMIFWQYENNCGSGPGGRIPVHGTHEYTNPDHQKKISGSMVVTGAKNLKVALDHLSSHL
jgi:hypothetical protein